jgi:hypothetical protein
MTQEDIIRMAREAGLAPIYSACDEPGVRCAYEDWDEELERFAAAVRKEFALECIDLVAFYGGPVDLEAAIRARTT